MVNYPRVEIPNIDKLGMSFKNGAVKISFEVPMPGPEILKLIYLSGTAQPLNVIFESPQAEMDLTITPINLKTGEVMS